MFLAVLALLALGAGGLYVWQGAKQPDYVSPNGLLPIHWYRVTWNVGGSAAAANPGGAGGLAQAAMVAQGFTGALGVLPPVKRTDSSWTVTATGPYVMGTGTIAGVPGALTLVSVEEVNPPRVG